MLDTYPETSQEAPEGAPRIGPALSDASAVGEAYRAAHRVGLNLYPWQAHALDVAMSLKDNDTWLYREVCIVVARQNGKTEMLVPRIIAGLENGEQILHTAQNRIIPREAFLKVTHAFPDARIRLANGQERIETAEGGSYRIIAPQRGARGLSADLLIIDELREFEDFDFIAAAEPTLTASSNPQVIYITNAGTEKSIVLNGLRARAGDDPNLAYMEWSAEEGLPADDRTGWAQANPALGHGFITMERLSDLYEKYKADGQLAHFETEYLCRTVASMLPRLVADVAWQMARKAVSAPKRPAMGISVDPDGKQVSACIAWKQTDGSIGLMVNAFATGSPFDMDRFAADLKAQARAQGVRAIGFDPWTDQHLARHFPKAEAINGAEFANASERFVRAVETGGLHWEWADQVSAELPYASRRSTTGTAFVAERADEHRPITSVLAAIRAVWLASNPKKQTPAIF